MSEPKQSTAAPRRADAAAVDRCRSLLVHASLPAVLPAAEVLRLARACALRPFRAGEQLLARGSPLRSAWLVADGEVVVASEAASGGRRIAPGHWLALADAVLGLPQGQDAFGHSDGVLLEVALTGLHRPAPERVAEARALAVLLAAEAHRAGKALRQRVRRDVPARVAGWLIDQASAALPGHVLRLNGPKREVAHLLGTTSESFSRALRQLRSLGAIAVNGRVITLLDPAALRRAAEPAARR